MKAIDRDVVVLHPVIATAGRVMFTLIFFVSGVTHFTDLDLYVAMMPSAIPFPEFWVMLSAIVELCGATLILTNRYPRLGGWLIALFLTPVTIAVHGVGFLTSPPEMQRTQASFFLMCVTMTGAALLITQLGAGGARRSARARASASRPSPFPSSAIAATPTSARSRSPAH